jgi:hypothetical protein
MENNGLLRTYETRASVDTCSNQQMKTNTITASHSSDQAAAQKQAKLLLPTQPSKSHLFEAHAPRQHTSSVYMYPCKKEARTTITLDTSTQNIVIRNKNN